MSNTRENFNVSVINRLVAKYGLSKDFIRKSIRGDRNSETSERVKKDYRIMLRELENTLSDL